MIDARKWRHATTGSDAKAALFGVNIWDYYPWEETGKTAKVRDPLYRQKYAFPVYRALVNGQEREFAAGEFSNGVWGFFLPEDKGRLFHRKKAGNENQGLTSPPSRAIIPKQPNSGQDGIG